MKLGLIVVGVVIIGTVIAGAMIAQTSRENARREAARQALIREMDAIAAPSTQPLVSHPAVEEPAPELGPPTGVGGHDIAPVSATAPSVEPAKSARAIPQNQNGSRRQTGGGRGTPAPNPNPQPDKPIARQALALVGADPVAEQVWMSAINDPNTSAHDRSDLIEDLNEDGFDDPKNLTPDDLPLIENRLALIEQLGPDAMDDVNSAAFAEAYKDLINMRVRVMRQ